MYMCNTTVGLAFILVPQILSLIIAVIFSKGFIGWLHGSYIIGMITPFLFVLGAHFCATKFFQGKGDAIAYFRVLAYTNIIAIVGTAVVLLMYIGGMDLLGLYSLVSLAMGIWMLIVTYTILMESYQMTSQNTIITMIITIVAVGIVVFLLNKFLFPNPFEEIANKLNDYTRYLK